MRKFRGKKSKCALQKNNQEELVVSSRPLLSVAASVVRLHPAACLSFSEILYEDLHFVAVFFAFLVAVAAVLVCLMWLCNKFAHLLQKERRPLKGN